MAVVNPAPWLQNSGAANTAQLMRLASSGLVYPPVPGTSSLGGKSGVAIRGGSNNYDTTQNGGGNMSVNVAPGLAYVRGTQSLTQGGYWVVNDATVNLAIAAAHPTNNRTDSVYVSIQDDFYSGGTHVGVLAVATGDPLFPTTPPTLPANSLEIARITVLAGTTTILTAQIADRRSFLAAISAIQVIQSFESADSGNIAGMHRYYGVDGGGLQRWDGTTWRPGSGMVLAAATGNVLNPTTGQLMSHTGDGLIYRYDGAAWKVGPAYARCSVYQNVAQSLTNATYGAVTFDQELRDTHTMHSTVSNTSRLVVPYDGDYWVSGGAAFAASATNNRGAAWRKNGTTFIRGSSALFPAVAGGAPSRIHLGRMLVDGLVAGDYLELMALQDSGGALNTSVGAATEVCCWATIDFAGRP